MGTLYGVVRISTGKQSTERQIKNIQARYPNAIIVSDVYTGSKLQGREKFQNLLKILKEGDTLVFDSVSRMSRNSQEGCELYENLFKRNINIEFLKEPHINTSVYRERLNKQIEIQVNTGNEATDNFINAIIKALNDYTIELAKDQIRKAFEQAEKELLDTRKRTQETLAIKKIEGKQIGQVLGAKLVTKKSKAAKEIILNVNVNREM